MGAVLLCPLTFRILLSCCEKVKHDFLIYFHFPFPLWNPFSFLLTKHKFRLSLLPFSSAFLLLFPYIFVFYFSLWVLLFVCCTARGGRWWTVLQSLWSLGHRPALSPLTLPRPAPLPCLDCWKLFPFSSFANEISFSCRDKLLIALNVFTLMLARNATRKWRNWTKSRLPLVCLCVCVSVCVWRFVVSGICL